MTFPVTNSASQTRSTSSPKNSTLSTISVFPDGKISTVSPLTRKEERVKSTSFRAYWMETSFRISSLGLISMPGRMETARR